VQDALYSVMVFRSLKRTPPGSARGRSAILADVTDVVGCAPSFSGVTADIKTAVAAKVHSLLPRESFLPAAAASTPDPAR
jgi:hypothetical protein